MTKIKDGFALGKNLSFIAKEEAKKIVKDTNKIFCNHVVCTQNIMKAENSNRKIIANIDLRANSIVCKIEVIENIKPTRISGTLIYWSESATDFPEIWEKTISAQVMLYAKFAEKNWIALIFFSTKIW